MDECTCRNKSTQLASLYTQFWTPRVLFPVSGISIPAHSHQAHLHPSNYCGLSIPPWYYSPTRPSLPARGPRLPTLLWSLTFDLQDFFLVFLHLLPHSSTLTLTLADPPSRPAVRCRHLPGVSPSKDSPTTLFWIEPPSPSCLVSVPLLKPAQVPLLDPLSLAASFSSLGLPSGPKMNNFSTSSLPKP